MVDNSYIHKTFYIYDYDQFVKRTCLDEEKDSVWTVSQNQVNRTRFKAFVSIGMRP